MQGRFKRDSKAAAAAELRGSSDRGSAPQRARDDGHTPLVRNLEGADNAEGSGGVDDSAVGGPAAQEPSAGSRLALRNWRISTRLVSLLALPVVAATALGAFRVVDANEEAQQLEKMKLLTEMTQEATALAAALQEERDRSAGPMTAHGNAKDDTVAAPRQRTDQAKKSFDEKTKVFSGEGDELAGVRATVVGIGRQLGLLKDIRDRSYERDDSIAETVSDYNRIIDSLLALSQDMAQATSNPDMINSTRALAAFSTSKEYASIQRAIISAGLANPDGAKLSENDRRFGGTARDNEAAALARFNLIYGDGATELTKSLTGGIVNIASADAYASRVFKSPDGIKTDQRSYMDWYDQDRTKIDEMEKIEATLLTQMDQQARELRKEAERDVILNGAFIVLVLGISLVGAFVVARSMVKSLRRLQDTAQEVSRRRLPELVKQLSESDPQEVDTTVESVGVHSRDEIGRVAAAFDDVHREAVRLAGEQALLRGNVNAMFTNLSRRSQGLIQRQLSLISELESREADPDQLASLFKLDHLATRMRRNGENLLVLAGEEPGRRWTRPVPLVDVLRAAASEVEQYERIELSGVPTIEVAGRVVNDLVHLLAELLENATSFSSPQTKVKVTGHALPDGRVLVEIHDTGIGLSPDDLADINDRLNSPPIVDVSVSRRMGLFVVGRLSLRHGIRIQLRPSDSGGTTALVMLPVEVTQNGQAARGVGGLGGPGAPAPRLQKPQGGTPGTSRLGALPTRGQVSGGGSRPALPGAGQRGGGPGGPGAARRPGGQVPPAFGGGVPGSRPPRPATPSPAEGTDKPRLPARGGPVGELPARQPQHQEAGQGPESVSRSDAVQRPEPGERPGFGLGSASTGRPQLPQRGQSARPSESYPDSAQSGGQRPSWASGEDTAEQPRVRAEDDRPRGHEEPASGGNFSRPGGYGALPVRSDEPGQQAERPGLPRAPQPAHDDTTELDIPIPATATAQTRTPIFEQMESSWFSRDQQPAEPSQPAPETPAPRNEPPAAAASPIAPPPQRQAGDVGSAPQPSGGGGMGSANDERWRRAERLRQPAAGGVTNSGLPRRVPKANLVEGTAQQPAQAAAGPQVSRAPDAVRGRLTNLRRGIQQGRQAGGASGSNDRGAGPSYPQER